MNGDTDGRPLPLLRFAPTDVQFLRFTIRAAVFVPRQLGYMVFQQVAEALKRRLCALLGVYLVEPAL